jgi:hypothetical protein
LGPFDDDVLIFFAWNFAKGNLKQGVVAQPSNPTTKSLSSHLQVIWPQPLFHEGKSLGNKGNSSGIKIYNRRLSYLKARQHGFRHCHILRKTVNLQTNFADETRFIGDRAGNYFKRDDPYFEATDDTPGVFLPNNQL